MGEKEIWVGENRIYLDEDNIIHYIFVGRMDEKIAFESCEAMLKLKNIAEGTVNFFIDLEKGVRQSGKARSILKEFTEKNVDGKLAFSGLTPLSRLLAKFFTTITKKKEMRFFKTREEALTWLRE